MYLSKTEFSSIYQLDETTVIKKVHDKRVFDNEVMIYKHIGNESSSIIHLISNYPSTQELVLPRADMDLFTWLFTNDSLSVRQNTGIFLSFLLQFSHGLHFLYEKGVEHYDIKCENIFIMEGTHQLKIGDFGASVLHGRMYHKYRGTLSYIAPELIYPGFCDEYVPFSFDVFSASFTIIYALLPDLLDTFYRDKYRLTLSEYQERNDQFLQSCSSVNPLVHPLLDILQEGILLDPRQRIKMPVFTHKLITTLTNMITILPKES